MVGLADDGLAVDGLLEVPGGGCGTRPTSTSRQDSYRSVRLWNFKDGGS